ncbi:MAG: hypothetical protein ACK58T_13940, partial [Phycisphaerae bacterium]
MKDVHRKPIPDTRFELRYEAPGTFISDSRAADGSTTEGRSLEYRVPASPTAFRSVVEEAKRGKL